MMGSAPLGVSLLRPPSCGPGRTAPGQAGPGASNAPATETTPAAGTIARYPVWWAELGAATKAAAGPGLGTAAVGYAALK